MIEPPPILLARRSELVLPPVVRPRTDTEARLAVFFAAALELDEVGVEDSFFELGGDSLRASRLLERLRGSGHELTARQLLGNPTVARLGLLLDGSSPAHEAAVDIGRPSTEEGADTRWDDVPLSVQQQAIWFVELLAPGAVGYNALARVTLDGVLDVPRLRSALSAVIARHPALRTRFPENDDGVPVQRMSAEVEPELDVVTALGPIADLVRRVGAHGFDLAHGPPVRWTLVRLAPERHVLLQVEHHFAHDGWSMWVLLQDIASAYRQLGSGPRIDLGADGTSYAAYCRWQRDWLLGRQAKRQVAHWIREVGPLGEPLRWPAENGRRPPRFTQRGETAAVTLDDAVRTRLHRYAGSIDATPFAVLMACYVVLIGQECGTAAPVLGSMLRNRRLPGVDRTVGMFVNTVALAFPGWEDQDVARLAREITARLADALDHQEIPFPLVAKELGVSRDLSRNPVFQTCFSMNDWPDPRLDFGDGISTEVDFPGNGGAKFDLDVVVVPTADSTALLWRYSTPLFDDAEVTRLADRYLRLLDHTVLGD
ncbi:MAG TPA: condensation domain-containing protein [Umezawaea sp.]|nr:condensation domain-containing protein [Umezawaea sp.]